MIKKDTKLKNKYLAIGTKIESKALVSYEWEDVPADLNLADFDRVIIDLYTIYKNPDKIKYLQLEKYNIHNLVFNADAEIIVIGIPGYIRYEGSSYSVLWWLPIEPKYADCKGDTFKSIKNEFEYYFKLVDEWYYHFEKTFAELDREKIRRIFRDVDILGEGIEPTTYILAENIYGKPLSLKIQYLIAYEGELIKTSAKIIWLPPPTKVETEEAIVEILKERYEIILIQDEPDWVNRYKLPVQTDIENRLDNLNEKIGKLNKQKDDAKEELQEELFLRKLLYEKGEALEKVVLATLKILGADIQEVKGENVEDGRITDPYGRNYIIEIKGRNGQLKRDDIRQLNDWIQKAMLEEDWMGKGILIGNYFSDKKLAEREYPIHKNEKNPLKRFEFSVIKTTLYNTNGLCDLPDL